MAKLLRRSSANMLWMLGYGRNLRKPFNFSVTYLKHPLPPTCSLLQLAVLRVNAEDEDTTTRRLIRHTEPP